jgi:hypothetical protein
MRWERITPDSKQAAAVTAQLSGGGGARRHRVDTAVARREPRHSQLQNFSRCWYHQPSSLSLTHSPVVTSWGCYSPRVRIRCHDTLTRHIQPTRTHYRTVLKSQAMVDSSQAAHASLPPAFHSLPSHPSLFVYVYYYILSYALSSSLNLFSLLVASINSYSFLSFLLLFSYTCVFSFLFILVLKFAFISGLPSTYESRTCVQINCKCSFVFGCMFVLAFTS